MDSDAFDNELLNHSPLRDTDLWPSSPPAAIATESSNEQQSDNNVGADSGDDDSLDADSGDDDGLYSDASPGGPRDDCSEGSFGDEEQVVVAADQYLWKIDHSKGDHKLKGVLVCGGLHAYGSATATDDAAVQDFIAATESPSFDGSQAIDMLQRRYTIDYGSRKADSRAAALEDELHTVVFP
jgi:hypothetical protein